MFLLRKDVVGWMVSPLHQDEPFDGSTYQLESGERIGYNSGWLACSENLQALSRGQKKLLTLEEVMSPDLTAKQLMRLLEQFDYRLDSEWRLRRWMGAPFTNLLAKHARALVEIHKEICKGLKKDPKTMPQYVGWHEQQKQPVIVMPQGGALVPEIDGEIVLYRDQLGHRQVVLKGGDWYGYPKAASNGLVTLFWMEYMQRTEPSGCESISELLGKDKFVTPEGLLCSTASTFTISVDDILGGGTP